MYHDHHGPGVFAGKQATLDMRPEIASYRYFDIRPEPDGKISCVSAPRLLL